MKILSVFNNKGGVGKTTLTYHLGHALSEMGNRVLMIDCDPQCNLTIFSVKQEVIQEIWAKEDVVIDEGLDFFRNKQPKSVVDQLNNEVRSLHYILKPTEEGTGEHDDLPNPLKLSPTLDLIPGRLSLHIYEEKVADRWASAYRGDPLSIRTITRIRTVAEAYAKKFGYDYVIIDTSPSLGSLNKVVISTVDGFFIPAMPDLFSLYGIKNIGKAISKWKSEFEVIYKLISDDKRHLFPKRFVSFLGYTLYNAKPYSGVNNKWRLSKAHLFYAEKIPAYIKDFISLDLREHLPESAIESPIGGEAVMHTHNTYPAMSQAYHVPMWLVPSVKDLEVDHLNSVRGASSLFQATRDRYKAFASDLIERIKYLG